MKRFVSFLCFGLFFLFIQFGQATSVYYQPTPFPLTISQSLNIVHLWDGWLPSVYYGQEFTRDENLRMGGWGDQYRIFLRFDIDGLPVNPDLMVMYLKSYDAGGTPTPFALCKIGSSWSTDMTWDTQPSFPTCWGWYDAPTPGDWWGISLTSLYNDWKSGTVDNNGVMLFPQNTNNNFDTFRSSRYTSTSTYRPTLRFDFTPTIALKMPLPGNYQWLVTTDVGGWDCKGTYDQYHGGSNYFSIDFSWRNIPDPGMVGYAITSDIPILAAAGGKVVISGTDEYHDNGFYVVIDHDGDGNIGTGVSTRYLHLKYAPEVSENDTVQQGQILGYMGNTGISDGVHLHFGVRYANNGSSSVSQLTKVIMETQLLKGYQTECSVDSNGEPTDWIHYYQSSNFAY